MSCEKLHFTLYQRRLSHNIRRCVHTLKGSHDCIQKDFYKLTQVDIESDRLHNETEIYRNTNFA